MKIKTIVTATKLSLFFALSALSANSFALEPTNQALKPFTVEDLVTMERISSPVLSPDSSKLVYVVRTTDLDANKGRTDLWLADLAGKDSKIRQLTQDPASDHSPKWADDGKSIFFLSSRSGSAQVWNYDLASQKETQISHFSLDVSSFKLSPNNKTLLFSASVLPDCPDFACTVNKLKQAEKQKHSGVVYTQMFVRHWDHWIGNTQSQLFLAELNAKGQFDDTKVKPISRAVNANVPSDPFGGDEEYTFSADGQNVYFSARLQNGEEPSSTNFDIYQLAVNSPDQVNNLTEANPAWDTAPVVSHSGDKLAYLAMLRPGFEADRFEVMLRDLKTGLTRRITKDWDSSFASLAFSKDDQYLYLTGNHLGTKALWRLHIDSGKHQLFNQDGSVMEVSPGSDKLVYAKDDLKSPVQLFSADLDGKNPKQLTFNNEDKLAQIAFGDYQQFSFKGWNDEKVHGFIVKPYDYQAGQKYPLAFLIHGGPQGSFGDHFHYRWNPQTYTGQGYVAVMIDFHGSTGYGQDFTDSISQNWGSKPFEDLQKGLAYVVENFDFVDGNKVCALGASYGGYMINWIAGNWPDRFQCLVNHDGVFDNRMMYYATEELWFSEWENGGAYFNVPEKHEKYNPVNFVNNWKTPMMLVQGELDYRIPVTQSLAAFTALQKKGIQSKLLYFPDENHWVLKPANSIQWHHEVNDWLASFLKNTK